MFRKTLIYLSVRAFGICVKGAVMTIEESIRENGSKRVKIIIDGESKTEQSHKDVTNINKIMERATRGIPPRVAAGNGLYGDFSSGMDLQDVMNRVTDAKRDFMSLPSHVRKRFDNDVVQLLDFISDPSNNEEAVSLGLLPEVAAKPYDVSKEGEDVSKKPREPEAVVDEPVK